MRIVSSEESRIVEDKDNPDWMVLVLDKEISLHCTCGARLAPFGSALRNFRGQDSGEKIRMKIPRGRCTNPKCRKCHRILPEGGVPYKQYMSNAIEAELDPGMTNFTPAEEKPVSSWQTWLKRVRGILCKAAENIFRSEGISIVIPLPKNKCRNPLKKEPRNTPGWLGKCVPYAVNAAGSM